MAAVEVPQTLKYMGGQLNAALVLENKGLIIEAYEWDEEDVSSDDNEMVEVKVEEQRRVDQLIEDSSSSGLKDLVFIKSSADDTKVSIPGVERPWFFEAEGFILPNHDTSRILLAESQRNTTDPLVAVTGSSMTDYDSTDESLVCSIPLPPLKKLDGAEPISGPKTIKLVLRSKSTFKAEALKCVIINELLLRITKALQLQKFTQLLLHLKSLGRMSSRPNIPRPSKRLFPPCIHCGGIDHLSNECLYYPICKLCGSYDHDTNGHNRIISQKREINPRNPQKAFKICEACGSPNHTTTDHYDIEWFKRGEALQAKKAEALKLTRVESSDANISKTPTKSGCSRHMTSVKSYLYKYVEQPGPKVVFGDDSTCTTEGYGSININEKRGKIFNSNKEIVMIVPRVRDVYALDMTSSAQEYFYIHNHKDHLGKIKEKADDGYLLGYSLVSKAFRVFNTRRQQTEETYHITFDESPKAIKFSKPSVDNINIAESERYLPDEYLHPYEPSQRYQTNSNDVSFIEPYEFPEPMVLETKVSSDQNDHTDQNDQPVQNDEILNDDHSKHSIGN
ncbi:retrovirus-related pol polyprotein from transposon TNT 1-94 [Tanacetum coccineum]